MDNLDQAAEDIFATALDMPIELRLAYVDAICRDQDDLHEQVVALLADHHRLGDFLESPPLPLNGGFAHLSGATSGGSFLSPGGKLGRYTILGPLGVGGTGAVYSARDERLERDVAIKILFPDFLLDAGVRARFRQEALALARLSHANIAAVHDVGEAEGMDYIVMERVTGQTLAATLRSGPMPIDAAVSIVHQVASALEQAHEFGVIHRDLKPGNIMITDKGRVKVLDFGIAKLAGLDAPAHRAQDPATCIGTPTYMSPEQVRGHAIDARTDLWSLGIVLYESLTGRPPFTGDSLFTTMQSILADTPAPPTTLRSEVPSAVELIVIRMLEKDPTHRYQSAAEAARATSSALATIENLKLASP